jgi:CheY-like chemotaxis protein
MKPQRILVVDDEPLNVELLDQELADLGYAVDAAMNGRDALDQVRSDPPDLILLDVLMPGIDGIEVCRQLKNDPATRLIPIVIMTALSDREDRIRAVEAGANDFLTKPVDERELHARIRSSLRSKAAIDLKVDELESATLQIEALGRHDEDVAVIVLNRGDTTDRDGFIAAVEGRGATVAETATAAVAAVFREADAATRLRSAVDLVLGLDMRSAVFGIAAGSAFLGAERVSTGDAHRWVMGVAGPAVAAAESAATSEAGGHLLVGEAALERLGTGYSGTAVGEVDGALLFDVITGDDDSAAHQVAFPAEFAEFLPHLREQWAIDDLYLTRLLSGKSGARVLLVDIECADFSGQAILKLEEPEDAPSDVEAEADRHRRAIDHDAGYAAAHLPRLIKFLRHGVWTATLSTIAAGGLEYCTVWFHNTYESQRAAAERVSLDILETWNADYRLAPGLVEPSGLLHSWLEERLELGESRLDSLLSEVLRFEASELAVILDGQWYPNPVAFARTQSGVDSGPPLRAAIGQMHGDLHGHNLLTSHRREGVSDYFLIDLAFYDEENYLFFDHAYFELSYLLRTREDATPGRWLELLRGVFADQPENADDIGILSIVNAVRSGQHQWINRHEEHRISYMESQMILAQVAAGLRFANMRAARGTKVHGFLYAAFALKEYIALHEIDWPRTGVVGDLTG